jgi:hypothetical protein
MTGSDGLNPYYGKGYNSDSKNVLNFDLSLTQKLDFITPGLNFKIKGAYNSTYNHTKTRSNSIPYYTPIKTADGTIEYRKSGDDRVLGYDESYGKARDWYAEASLNYNRTFGLHNVGALMLYNQSKTYYPSQYPDIPSGYVGLVGRLTYDWKLGIWLKSILDIMVPKILLPKNGMVSSLQVLWDGWLPRKIF